MTNKATKYGLMTIAAVLLVAMAFAGVASADYNASQWNALTDADMNTLTGTVHIVDTDTTAVIYPKFNGSTGFTPAGDLTLDFAGYKGTFSGDTNASTKGLGALFGFIDLRKVSTKRTITIENLTMRNVVVNATSGHCIGGIVGYFEGNSTSLSFLNFTNCQLKNCSISGTSSSNKLGCLVARPYNANMYAEDCKVENCNVVSGNNFMGGFVGAADTANFTRCDLINSKIVSNGKNVGGFIGNGASNYEFCNIENTFVSATGISVGGFAGYAYFVDKIVGCKVTYSVIMSSSYYVGGLVGASDLNVNGAKDCLVKNCTISGTATIGGLVGFMKKDAYGWDNNSVVNIAVNGSKKETNFVCGSKSKLENPDNCTVSGDNYIRNQSAEIPQPQITISKVSDIPSSDMKTAITVTKLSGIGTKNNPQYACGYVIDSSPAVFNPNVGSAEAYTGAIKIGAHSVTPYSAAGYTFNGWNLSSADGTNLTNAAGEFLPGVPGYTNATGYWNNVSGTIVALCANWTLNSTDVTATGNKAVFGNDNVTAIHSTSGTVAKVLLEDVSNVANSAVNFTADNTSVHIPSSVSGYNKEEISVFEINATADGTAKINVTITFKDAATVATEKDNVSFFHYNVSAWEPLNCTIASQTGAEVLYTVETTSFSPFGIGLSSPITYTVRFDANGGQGSMADMTFTYDVGQNLTANAFQRYNSNFLYWTYNGTKYYNTEFVKNLTVNQSEIVVMKAQWEGYSTGGSSSGSTYMGSSSASYTPTQQPTVKPTVAPTVKPTEKPATPTVIATEKPTTQATQQSPAPFVGLIAGLGAAGLVLARLRK